MLYCKTTSGEFSCTLSGKEDRNPKGEEAETKSSRKGLDVALGQVILGVVVSKTWRLKEQMPKLPAASYALYTMDVTAGGKVMGNEAPENAD